MKIIDNFLTEDEIHELMDDPTVYRYKQYLEWQDEVKFSIPMSESMKAKLEKSLNIRFDRTWFSYLTKFLWPAQLPMKWIRGDSLPHRDKSAVHTFKTTYLIYLNDSPGDFILEGDSFPIKGGSVYIFDEGLQHETYGTGGGERLIVGPMSECGLPVGFVGGWPASVGDGGGGDGGGGDGGGDGGGYTNNIIYDPPPPAPQPNIPPTYDVYCTSIINRVNRTYTRGTQHSMEQTCNADPNCKGFSFSCARNPLLESTASSEDKLYNGNGGGYFYLDEEESDRIIRYDRNYNGNTEPMSYDQYKNYADSNYYRGLGNNPDYISFIKPDRPVNSTISTIVNSTLPITPSAPTIASTPQSAPITCEFAPFDSVKDSLTWTQCQHTCGPNDGTVAGNMYATQVATNASVCSGEASKQVSKSCQVQCPCNFDGATTVFWDDDKCTADKTQCKLGDTFSYGTKTGNLQATNAQQGCLGPQFQPITGNCNVACPCVYDTKTILQDTPCSTTAYGIGRYDGHNPQTNGPHSCPQQTVKDVSCNYAFNYKGDMVNTYNPYTPLTGGFQPSFSFQPITETFTPSYDIRNASANIAMMYLDEKPAIDIAMNYQANLAESLQIFNNEYVNYIQQCNNRPGTYIPINSNNPNNTIAQVWGPEKGNTVPLNCSDLKTQLDYDTVMLNNYINAGSVMLDKSPPSNVIFTSPDNSTNSNDYVGHMGIGVMNKVANQYNHYQTTAEYDASYNFIKSQYPEIVKQRTDLDAKLRDLYDIPGSKLSSLDNRLNYDATMYSGILLTALASMLIYYTFTKL